LKNVQTLTLHKDKKTTHRRVSAIPQLKCIGGSGCRYHQVDVMRCENVGSDYDENSVQWTCRANVPEEFKLGSTDVRCEGYSSPSDPYILKGSCGVEYKLLLSDKGMQKYGHQHTYDISASGATGKLFSLVFWTLFFGVVFVMIRSAWRNMGAAPRRRNPPRTPREGWPGWFGGGGGGGGGGGPGGPDDPPPPYSPFPPRKDPSTGNWGARYQAQGFQPGFWSGVMGGAAAGYLAGNRRTRTNEPVVNGGREQGRSFYQRPSEDRGEGSSSSSSNYHQSTGFGGTSLR